MAVTNRVSRTRVLCLLGAMAALIASGCSKGFDNAPVDASMARECLQTAMESWKKGDKVDALQSANPPIYVIDMEWKNGNLLKDFEIVGQGEPKDAHLMCQVKLTLRASGTGKETKKEVTYIISTAPNITVSRKVF
jgi:hypothetical protein